MRFSSSRSQSTFRFLAKGYETCMHMHPSAFGPSICLADVWVITASGSSTPNCSAAHFDIPFAPRKSSLSSFAISLHLKPNFPLSFHGASSVLWNRVQLSDYRGARLMHPFLSSRRSMGSLNRTQTRKKDMRSRVLCTRDIPHSCAFFSRTAHSRATRTHSQYTSQSAGKTSRLYAHS
jgi:hypothetical protein